MAKDIYDDVASGNDKYESRSKKKQIILLLNFRKLLYKISYNIINNMLIYSSKNNIFCSSALRNGRQNPDAQLCQLGVEFGPILFLLFVLFNYIVLMVSTYNDFKTRFSSEDSDSRNRT